MEGTEEHDVEWRRVWRYQRDNQDPHIEEEQTTQFILLLVLTNSCNLFCHLKNVGLHYHVICQCVFLYYDRLSAKHTALRSKSKYLLPRNQDNFVAATCLHADCCCSELKLYKFN